MTEGGADLAFFLLLRPLMFSRAYPSPFLSPCLTGEHVDYL